MTTLAPAQPRAPRVPPSAFTSIVLNEARLAWRQPAGMIAGTGIAMLILVIFGEIPVFGQSSAKLGGYTPFEVYIPILTCFAIAIIAFTYLPGPLVSYRELGILRRLSTTPVPAYWVLAAQIVVQACLMTVTLALLVSVSIVFFGITRQDDPGCGDGAAVTPIAPDDSRRQFGGARRALDALRDHDIAAPKALKPVIL